MIKLALIIACVLLSQKAFSQTASHDIKQQTDVSLMVHRTLKISTIGYKEKLMLDLKDELSNWKGKVISIDIDPGTSLFTLKHNSFMDERELFEVLNKYAITKESIISYQ